MNILFLLALALAPGIFILVYVIRLDRTEPEPMSLVIKVAAAGALSTIPAVFLELYLGELAIFKGKDLYSIALSSFFQVSLIEEICKLVPVLFIAWKNKNFNEANDGIVYASASALGFAMLENIFYVLQYGMGNGVLRAVTAMPLHAFTGIIMGYYIGRAKMTENAEVRRNNLIIGFFLAFFVHGLYDTFALSGTELALLIIPTVILLIWVGVKLLKKGSIQSVQYWQNKEYEQDIVHPNNIYEPRPIAAKPELSQFSDDLQSGTSVSNKKVNWQLIFGRIIFVLVGLVWAALILSIKDQWDQGKSSVGDIVLGGIILTAIPMTIAILLELSGRKKRLD